MLRFEAAVDAAAQMLNAAVKPVLIAGVKFRPLKRPSANWQMWQVVLWATNAV